MTKGSPYHAQTAAFLRFLKDSDFDRRKELWNHLIWLCIGLGCTLTETNAVLREANHALLYPPLERVAPGHRLPILLQNTIERENTRP